MLGSVGHLSIRCVKKSEEIEGLQVTRKTERIKSSGRENGKDLDFEKKVVGISGIHETDNEQMIYNRKQLTKTVSPQKEEDEKGITHQRKYSDYHMAEKDNSKEIEDLKQEVKKWKYNYKHLQ